MRSLAIHLILPTQPSPLLSMNWSNVEILSGEAIMDTGWFLEVSWGETSKNAMRLLEQFAKFVNYALFFWTLAKEIIFHVVRGRGPLWNQV